MRRWCRCVEGDVGDTQRLTDAIAAHQVVAVMHFAAFSQVGDSVGDPQKYYLNNVYGTPSLLKAML
jgi:UDP-glucose 4-epimerase